MKLGLIAVCLLLCQVSFAQTLREKKIKKEMLDRVDLIVEKIEATRVDLKDENVEQACLKIKEIFGIFPEHLKAVGSHLDLYRSKTIRAKDNALNELITIHKASLTCDQGRDHEYVNPKKMSKELKDIAKALGKQRKTIRKSDTDYENSFYYEYEF